MNDPDNLIFVYGTLLLKSGLPVIDFFHKNSSFVEGATFTGKLFEIDGYPGAVFSPDSRTLVHGKVFRMLDSKRVLAELDVYEETGTQFPDPNEYVRKKLVVQTFSGAKLNCWVYLYNWPVEELYQISSGNYLVFRNWKE